MEKVWIKRPVIEKDKEKNTFEVYKEVGDPISMNIWPASGTVQAEVYGKELKYIYNANVDKDADIAEGDAIYLKKDSKHPAYNVLYVSKPYLKHKVLELKAWPEKEN